MLDGKTAIPLYVQLEEQIQEKILSGIYQPGELEKKARNAEINYLKNKR